jgi:hypothetical protein
MPKSDCKKIYREILNTDGARPKKKRQKLDLSRASLTDFDACGFFDGAHSPLAATVVLQDGSVVFRKVGSILQHPEKQDMQFSCPDVVRMIYTSSLRWLNQYESVSTCIFVCDKPKFVPLAKCPEQRRRDGNLVKKSPIDLDARGDCKSAHSFTVLEHWFHTAALLSLNKENYATSKIQKSAKIPGWVWARLIEDRSTRQLMVRYLLLQGIAVLKFPLAIPKNKRIIVDFENSDPLVLHNFEDDCAVPWGHEEALFSNTIGEYDNCLAFWVHNFTKRADVTQKYGAPDSQQREVFLLDTIDTDLMFIATMFVAELLQPENAPGCRRTSSFDVIVRLAARVQPNIEPMHLFVNTEKLASRIRRAEMSVKDLIKTSVIAGSDFTSGFPGIAHRTVIQAYLDASRRSPLCLRRVIHSALSARSCKKTPSDALLNGQISRTMWTLQYWCCHFDGCADPKLPNPVTFTHTNESSPGWAIDSCFEHASSANIKEYELVPCPVRTQRTCFHLILRIKSMPMHVWKHIFGFLNQ